MPLAVIDSNPLGDSALYPSPLSEMDLTASNSVQSQQGQWTLWWANMDGSNDWFVARLKNKK